MTRINRDLDRYLRKRSQPGSYHGPGWFDKVFSQAEEEEKYEPEEVEKIEEMEHEIEQGEEQLEVVHEIEEDLEEQQEERVGIYHKVLRLFQRPEQPDDAELDDIQTHEDDAQDDFRVLAEIQVRWFSRLPIRAQQAFKDSEDYQDLMEIYERREVARRKP